MQIEAVVTFVIIFSIHMNVLHNIKVKILVLIKRRIRPPPTVILTIDHDESMQSTLFETHMSFGYPFLEPHQTTHHSNIGIRLR